MTPERIAELRKFKSRSDGAGLRFDFLTECLDEIDALRKRVEELEMKLGEAGAMSAVQDNAIVSLREKLRVANEALEIVAEGKEICGQSPNPEYVYVHGLTIENLQGIARNALKEIEK